MMHRATGVKRAATKRAAGATHHVTTPSHDCGHLQTMQRSVDNPSVESCGTIPSLERQGQRPTQILR